MGSLFASATTATAGAALLYETRENYRDWQNELEELERVAGKLRCVQSSVHEAFMRVDYPWLKKKQKILGLTVPVPEQCTDANRYKAETVADGKAVDRTGDNLVGYSPHGLPTNWYISEGEAQGHLVQTYTGGIIANASKRRQERFQENKTALVLKGHRAARMSLSAVLNDLNAAMGIHDSLSQTFAQGFQSSATGLGSLVGQLGGE